MADSTRKRSRRQINGRLPKPPFWLTSVILVGVCLSILLIAMLLNSRTSTSPLPRVHLIQDMDNQVKAKTQRASDVFADGREIRPEIPGTVKFGDFITDDNLAYGYTRKWNAAKKTWDITYTNDIPVKVDAALLGLDRDEEVTLPSVHDVALWDAFEAARLGLFGGTQNGSPAARYLEV